METTNNLISEEIDRMNQFNSHPPTSETIVRAHEKIREECLRLSSYISYYVPIGDEKDEALKKLQEVMFWSNAGIARNQNGTD